MLSELFKSTLDKHAPIKKYKMGHTNKSELSPYLKRKIKEMNKMWNELCKTRDKMTKLSKLKTFRDKQRDVKKIKKKAAIKCVEDKLEKGENPWNIVRKLLKQGYCTYPIKVDDMNVTNDYMKATIFNDFFIEKQKKISSKLEKNDIDPTKKLKNAYETTSEFEFKPLKIKEAKKMILSMKTSKSKGPDEISMCVIKKNLNELLPFITRLINESFASGLYPNLYNTAKLTPLHKANGKTKTSVENYRPISGLCTIRKIIENVANIQIMKYCEENNIFSKHQYAYRKGRSTTIALINALNRWQKEKKIQKLQAILMFDLSSCFDTIRKDILLDKLKIYGFGDSALSWLDTFLSSRGQFVQINGERSNIEEVPFGIPQGSSLSATLFILATSDIKIGLQGSYLTIFSDDTTLTVSGDNLNELQTKIQDESANLMQFLRPINY